MGTTEQTFTTFSLELKATCVGKQLSEYLELRQQQQQQQRPAKSVLCTAFLWKHIPVFHVRIGSIKYLWSQL